MSVDFERRILHKVVKLALISLNVAVSESDIYLTVQRQQVSGPWYSRPHQGKGIRIQPAAKVPLCDSGS